MIEEHACICRGMLEREENLSVTCKFIVLAKIGRKDVATFLRRKVKAIVDWKLH